VGKILQPDQIRGMAMMYLSILWDYWQSHGTRILGFISGTIAAVAGVGGLIPEAHLKYYMGVIAVMTFWRGHINSKV
jgi:hypothetical protein